MRNKEMTDPLEMYRNFQKVFNSKYIDVLVE